MSKTEDVLAKRLGMTVHESPLRMKLLRLAMRFPSSSAECLEDWLVDVANDRGARVVFREARSDRAVLGVTEEELSNEELVVGICQLQCLDRPQMLRLSAQLVSRAQLNMRYLCLVAEQERVGDVLASLARAALHVSPRHPSWLAILEKFGDGRPLRASLLHWTRLAEPVMMPGVCNAQNWKLVA